MKPIPFDNRYAQLPPQFYSQQAATPVAAPHLIRLNRPLAEALGIDADWLATQEGVEVLAGNRVAEGSQPIATVYAGHQFGGWNPRLGDGRAILLGEVVDRAGQRFDIQLKGAGRTPYSRGGDGRSPLGPVLREYIVSEAMAALGVPTTRSLAAVASGERVMRERPLPGAVLTRVAASHIRIGTFQYFAAAGDEAAVRALTSHVIERHYPEAAQAERPALALLQGVVAAQARLVARWQLLGFIHGVMNTDNMLLSGETVDYGPCAFMDNFHPDRVYSSIDSHGRYAYSNQPGIAQWNLAWLAQALLPQIDADEAVALPLAQQAITDFAGLYQGAYDEGMAGKLGLAAPDAALAQELLSLMAAQDLDFTLTFRRLAELAGPAPVESVATIAGLPAALDEWLQRWRQQLAPIDPARRQDQMYRVNPVFIPRNHLVEEVIRAATDEGDFALFHQLVERLAEPCQYDAASVRYATPPLPEQVVARTFCGT